VHATPPNQTLRVSRPLRVLHVESSLNWGGQEQRTLIETRWLRRHGHEAWIACNPDSELFARAGSLAIPVSLRRSLDLGATARLAQLCDDLGVDVLHAHSPKDAWLSAPLHAVGMPVVRSRQITNPVKATWHRSMVYRRGCSRVIAAAECIRRDLIARNGVDPKRICVIGEGVDLLEFNPDHDGSAFRREFGVASDEVLFGLVAMIRPEKGHLVFLSAAEEVLAHHTKARFAIVGCGTGAGALERQLRVYLAQRQGSHDRGPIFMSGFRSDAPHVMAALDVLVVPSVAEAQSLVAPQAFATGKPVIASRVGGLPELVRDGKNGLLVAPNNPAELASAMRALLKNPAWRRELGQRGLAFASTFLRLEDRMEESVAVYREVLGPRRPRVRGALRQRLRRTRRRSLHALSLLAVTLALWLATGIGANHSAAFLASRAADDFHLDAGMLTTRVANLDDLDNDDPTDLLPNSDDDDDDIVT
jgi:glycosyltransferase involved in cell wall biosynthesis